MPIVIRAENIGKLYRINHETQGRGFHYKTLREAIVDTGKAIGRGLRMGKQEEIDRSEEDFWALQDISFEIQQGDRVGIIGRNGAGKSTLLKILSRIVPPTTGKVTIEGRVASLLEVGTGFHPELTGRENIFLNGAILGMRKQEIKRKFDEIVAFAEVEKFLDTPVKHYSSGMYVRLAFAVAAHLEPDILFVDEVLAVGDAQFQKKCLGKMEDVSKEGRTILFVSHNMQAIRQLCTRTFVLDKAKIAYSGNCSKAISHYFGADIKLDLMHISAYKHKRAYLKYIEFLDELGKTKQIFLQSDKIQVRIVFVIQEAVKEFSIAMAILHGDGLAVFSEALCDQVKPTSIQEGEYSISFFLNLSYLKLEPYFLAVHLTDMMLGESLDYNNSIPLPEIKNPSADTFIESRRWGVVRLPVKWSEIEAC